LKETGTVWEACDRLKGLPKDTRELLLKNMAETLTMVNDAFSEIQEMNVGANSSVKNDEDDEEDGSRSLNDQEKLQLHACSQLVKAAKATITKARTTIEQSNAAANSTAAADDELIPLVNRISPSIDNVVSSFYEGPIDSEALSSEVTGLHDNIKDILITFRKTAYYQDEHSKWLDILCTAVQHNLLKYRDANEKASK